MFAKRHLFALVTALVPLTAIAQSPYAGQESRELKALSADEVASYVEGKGLGFAKPAELNGFPGPMHVLELADGLELTPEQRAATRKLMERHKAEARALGREYVENERRLERLFALREATPEAVSAAVARSAEIHARIRASHLVTHIEQTRLLEPAQVGKYAVLRGYTGGGSTAPGHHKHH
jgi:Spy/CpxP family protein refolding chaperone